MAKPRIFVSSTYYDLKHIRTSLESFINSFGYEPVLFESGDIFFSHEMPLDESCYNELKNCHMQLLIIGGSYGSAESGTKLSEEDKKDPYKVFNSITRKEFQVAHKRQIPIYFFVENGVLSEYNTFKKNRDNTTIQYAHVSNVGIFHLLDEIYGLQNGNFIHGFTKFEDISEWLKMQWAHLMAEFINNRSEQLELKDLSSGIKKLNNLTDSLKEYTEAILNTVEPAKADEIKKTQDKKHQEFILDYFKDSELRQQMQIVAPHIGIEELFSYFNKVNTFDEFAKAIVNRVNLHHLSTYSIQSIEQAFINLKVDLSLI